MFSADLIDKSAFEDIREGYSVRPMRMQDYEGVLDVLSVLTIVGSISKNEFEDQIQYWSRNSDTYFPVVITNEAGKVVACGSLIVERKLVHARGLVGHIEDIAVAKDQQGLKLGKHLISTLTGISKKLGCYKVILDCDEKNVGFYEKCGYRRAGVEMDIRF